MRLLTKRRRHREDRFQIHNLALNELTEQVSQLRAQVAALDQREQERSHLAASVDLEISDAALDFAELTTDQQYAKIMSAFVGQRPTSKAGGELIDIMILGELLDGSIAWVNEKLTAFGQMHPEMLGDELPMPDDRLRARVTSYPWGHVVTAVAPKSLTRSLQARELSTNVSNAGTIPSEQRGTFRERLQPGDIVLARIPYDGASLAIRGDRIAKYRPAVFIRWEQDYAILRAIYDLRGYVSERGLGTPIHDRNVLAKPSVVRNAEYDIQPSDIVKFLGALAEQDLLTLNLPVRTGGTSPASLDMKTPAPAPARPLTATPRQSVETRGDASVVSLEMPEDYVTPDVIIYDQFSIATRIQGARLDLGDALMKLRDESSCDAWVVGSDAEARWASFQRAAISKGWKVAPSETRDDFLKTAVRLARESDAQIVTLVGGHADVIAELENLGYEVCIVDIAFPS